MNIIVLLKQVPDLVEDLEITSDEKCLDREWIKLILNEPDNHALEQALIIKEKIGGTVRVFVLQQQEDDDLLYTAIAKGADSVTKIVGDFSQGVDSHSAAALFAQILKEIPYDMIVTGVQAIDDLDGQAGALLASYLDIPYVGGLNNIQLSESSSQVMVSKEFPGGATAQISVQLPAVFGIQAAPTPPRYVPIARIRQAMKTTPIQEVLSTNLSTTFQDGGIPIQQQISVARMYKPESSGKVEIIQGSMNEIAEHLTKIFIEKGLVK